MVPGLLTDDLTGPIDRMRFLGIGNCGNSGNCAGQAVTDGSAVTDRKT